MYPSPLSRNKMNAYKAVEFVRSPQVVRTADHERRFNAGKRSVRTQVETVQPGVGILHQGRRCSSEGIFCADSDCMRVGSLVSRVVRSHEGSSAAVDSHLSQIPVQNGASVVLQGAHRRRGPSRLLQAPVRTSFASRVATGRAPQL